MRERSCVRQAARPWARGTLVSIDAGTRTVMCTRGTMRGERRPAPRGRRAAALSTAIGLLVLPAVGGTLVVKDNLYAVKAMGDAEAWAVGNVGSIHRTRDAGQTWHARDGGAKRP